MTYLTEQFIDPKTSFLLSLIHEMDQISWELRYGSGLQAAKNLSVVMDRIDYPDSNEKMKEVEQLLEWDRLGLLQFSKVKQATKTVNSYLNGTYFKGFKGIIKDKDFDELDEGEEPESQMDT